MFHLLIRGLKMTPKFIALYDNGGLTADRFTCVFTDNLAGYHISFSGNPFHPHGICTQEYSSIKSMGKRIDKPSHKHLGVNITFNQLNDDCKRVVMLYYREIAQEVGLQFEKIWM